MTATLARRETRRMSKGDVLDRWAALRPDAQLNPTPVPYKHEGSTFAEDGVRVTGSLEWIDAVLSRLKPLLAHEGDDTRLQVSMQPVKDKDTGVLTDSWSCYVQVHERGREARVANRLATGRRR